MNIEKTILAGLGLVIIITAPLSALYTNKIQSYKHQTIEMGAELEDARKQGKNLNKQIEEANKQIRQLKKQLQARAERQSSRLAVSTTNLCNDYRDTVGKYFGVDTDKALAIMFQESRCNNLAVNWGDDHSSWAGCKGSFGLFQLNCGWGQIYDAEENIKIAAQMYKHQGTFCKTSGWYNSCKKLGWI